MRNRLAALCVATTVATLSAASWAQDLPSGYGVPTPHNSVFTTEISPGGDSDDYVFKGFPGMVVTASVKPSKVTAPAVGLTPELLFVRPGGSVATDEDGFSLTVKGTSRVGTMKLDATGWWQIRVRGVDTDPSGAVVTRSSGPYSFSLKYGAPSLVTLPVVSKSYKLAGVIASRFDTDDSTFQGYPGQTLSAVLKAAAVPKGAQPLIPAMELFKPDGTIATNAVYTVKGGTVTMSPLVIDQQGTWRIHIIGLEPIQPDTDPTTNTGTTGAYSLSVKLGKLSAAPSIQPDANGQYRFTIPGVAGATIGYTLKFTGAAPTFNGLIDPTGKSVIGISTSPVVPAFALTAEKPFGAYTLTFTAPTAPTPAPTGVTFVPKIVLPKPLKPRKAVLSKDEPFVVVTPTDSGVHPPAGGPSTTVTVNSTDRLLDPTDPDPDKCKLYLGHTLLLNSHYDPNTRKLFGTVPAGVPIGSHDIVIESSTGQQSVLVGGFASVERPRAVSVDPAIGSAEGGYEITITGSGFRPGRVGILIDGNLVAPFISSVTDTSVTFISPQWSPSPVTFGVVDRETQLAGNLQLNSFEYIGTAAISRIVPSITTVLGGDLISVKGASFEPTDHVFLEKDGGGFEEMLNTYRDDKRHEFIAPPRQKGDHLVYVVDQFFQPNPPRTRVLTYFQLTHLTLDPSVMPAGSDQWDGITTATGDFDRDGSDDLFITRVGGSTASATSHTRVLQNDGSGHFTDVTDGTDGVMPAVAGGEDWRGDRIWIADVNLDGYVDIFLVSNDNTVLNANKSHLRILVNEPRTITGSGGRIFRDRTLDLMPAVRSSSQLYGGGGLTVVDSWRGLDMWVGDVDKGPYAPPEIIITHKELKQEIDVGCGNYCASPYSGGYTYGFYWGGSRAFVWNPAANAGQGKYKFEHNFFPRKAGVRVNIFNPPGGVKIPICNAQYGSPCAGKFTPFTGKRVAVGDINIDGKPDVAILSDDPVTRDGVTIASLQVGINKFNSADGAFITDVTSAVGDIAGSFQADTIEIGQPGYPDGNSFGVMAVTKAGSVGGLQMRLIKFKTPSIAADIAEFEEITTAAMPPITANDKWQASRIFFRDVDTDGDQDMIMVCNAPPGGVDPAFRVLRNERVGTNVGVLRETMRGLITPLLPASDHFEGDSLAIGDVNKDGTFDFIITRAGTTSPAPQTRILITDKTKAP